MDNNKIPVAHVFNPNEDEVVLTAHFLAEIARSACAAVENDSSTVDQAKLAAQFVAHAVNMAVNAIFAVRAAAAAVEATEGDSDSAPSDSAPAPARIGAN